jgi:septal ring factor EnvC (AmiA/AmiB activator)
MISWFIRGSLRRAGGVGLAVAATALTSLGAGAQPPAAPASASAQSANEKAAREQELQKLRAEQKQAAESQAKLAAEIAAIGRDRAQLSHALIETAGRLRDVEARVAAAEDRLKALDANEQGIRSALDGRRAVIVELLAALQRIGRRPPPALLVRPQDALAAVRTAIMLGAVVPEMRAETEKLAADLTGLVTVRREIAAERERLGHEMAGLSADRLRMTALVEERQKRQSAVEQTLADERQRAAVLARQVGNLKDLLAKLDQQAAAARAGPPPGAAAPDGAAPGREARLTPTIAFAATKGTLPFPVNGVKIRVFGQADGTGGTAKGSTVGTRPGAQVTAPCDGWVRYAGPFRSYGQLLILDAGGGYHVLLAGMERISVDLGQFVLTGEPVAVMGGGPKSAASGAIGISQPTLYIEFRKDGTPIDPGPWWTAKDSEKVRG